MIRARIIVLVALSALTSPALAVTHERLGPHPGILDLTKADSIQVIRLDPSRIAHCDWDFSDSLMYTHCYRAAVVLPAPDAEWAKDLGNLLAASRMAEWEFQYSYKPQAMVRFIQARDTSNLVILTLPGDRSRIALLLIVPDAPMERRELVTGREDFRALMAYGFSAGAETKVTENEAEDFPGSNWVRTTSMEELPAEGDWVKYEDEPVPVTRVEPVYPEFAKEAQIQGKVTMHVLVGADGRVREVKVIRGVTELNGAAVDAVKRWVFKPALSDHKPVAVWVEVPMDFPPHRPSGN